MRKARRFCGLVAALIAVGLSCGLAGCIHGSKGQTLVYADGPREGGKISLPPYIIEPPDILQIDAVRVVPKPPYKIEPLDAVFLNVEGTLVNKPIVGVYPVEPDGSIQLGFDYGMVAIAGMTLEEAKAAIEKHLKLTIAMPKATIALAQAKALQQIRGEHLVRPDGTVSLGTYGAVHVSGMTLVEAKLAIEQHLSRYLNKPEIAIDVLGYNSKKYYIIIDGGGYGEQVIPVPSTGNETVLDAMGQIGGLPSISSKKKIWIARPNHMEVGTEQILPVDWNSITKGGDPTTNYQVMPGDRIYVKADHMIAFDNHISKLVAPFERMMGFTLLTNGTVRAVGRWRSSGDSGSGFGGF